MRKIFCMALAVIGLSSCQMIGLRGIIEDIVANGNATVHMAGYTMSGTTHYPCTWMDSSTTNPSRTLLPNDNYPGEARSIHVAGGQTYVAGYLDASGTQYACWWNGMQREYLDGSSTQSLANGIFYYEGKIYIVGQYEAYPRYWLRGNENGSVTFGPPRPSGGARSVFVDATGFYFAGWENLASQTPCYWRDASATINDLAVPGQGTAQSIVVGAGGTVYTAGSWTNGGTQTACAWTNDVRTDLDSNTAYGMSVFVVNTDVYVGGFFRDSGAEKPCYWRNGTRTALDIPVEATGGHVYGISAYHNTVYAAGDYTTSSGLYPCYWMNGQCVDLKSSDSNQGSVLSIFITTPAGQP